MKRIDQKDHKIIAALYENGRASIQELAEMTGIRRDTVVYRLKRLQLRGVIERIQPIIQPRQLGYQAYVATLIKVKPQSEKREIFEVGLLTLGNVTHCVRVLGKYDYLLMIAGQDVREIDRVFESIKAFSPGFIDDIESLSVVEELKVDNFAGLFSQAG